MSEDKYPDGAPILTLEEVQALSSSGLFQLLKAVHALQKIIMEIPEIKEKTTSHQGEIQRYLDSINNLFSIIERMRGFK